MSRHTREKLHKNNRTMTSTTSSEQFWQLDEICEVAFQTGRTTTRTSEFRNRTGRPRSQTETRSSLHKGFQPDKFRSPCKKAPVVSRSPPAPAVCARPEKEFCNNRKSKGRATGFSPSRPKHDSLETRRGRHQAEETGQPSKRRVSWRRFELDGIGLSAMTGTVLTTRPIRTRQCNAGSENWPCASNLVKAPVKATSTIKTCIPEDGESSTKDAIAITIVLRWDKREAHSGHIGTYTAHETGGERSPEPFSQLTSRRNYEPRGRGRHAA